MRLSWFTLVCVNGEQLGAGEAPRVEWIAPPRLPGEPTSEALRESLRTRPRIMEAWVVGTRAQPVDGWLDQHEAGHPYDVTSIGLVFDPPLVSYEERHDDFLAIAGELTAETGFGLGRDEGWQVLTATEISSHVDHVLKIYSRPRD